MKESVILSGESRYSVILSGESRYSVILSVLREGSYEAIEPAIPHTGS